MNPEEQYIMINVNEEIVKTQALELMPKAGICCCEKCLKDVCAITLNSIPSHYVTSRKGETIANVIRGELDNRVEVVVAVSKAIGLVQGSPQH